LNPEKCHWCETKINILGFVISENTIAMDPKKVEAIVERKEPRNITELQSFQAVQAVQEHRLPADKSINIYTETYKEQEWRFDYCSAVKTSHGNHVGGIGLLMSSEAASTLLSSTKITDRIMTANFAGNPATTVIVAYAPTEEKTEKVKDEFYAELLKCAQDVPPHNMLVIAGDFNARIGQDSSSSTTRVIGKHFLHEETNDNGNRLVEFCEAADMRPAQFKFPHPKQRIWTWQPERNRTANDGKNRAQLDHIIVSGKWTNSVQNVRAYSTDVSDRITE
jgi:hypothetical protein